MTFDETNKVTLLFGGAGATHFRDLWSWDGSSWTRLANDGPSPRDDALLVHDRNRGRTVLFGGRARNGGLLADTWEWNGVAWARRGVAGPQGRLHAAGAFDPLDGCLRVYGGTSSGQLELTDTWEWDGSTWTRVAERGAVAGKLPNRMAFDRSRGRTVLSVFDPLAVGPAGTMATELWEWDGGAWRALGSSGPAISPVQDMTGLGGGGLLLLDGGALHGEARTWLWSKGIWLRAAGGPTPRNGHALAFDTRRGCAVLFGGFRDGRDFDDTWEWNGLRWTRVSAP